MFFALLCIPSFFLGWNIFGSLLFCPTVFLPTINIKIKNPHQPPVHKNSHGFSTRKGKLERVVCFEREAEFALDSSPFLLLLWLQDCCGLQGLLLTSGSLFLIEGLLLVNDTTTILVSWFLDLFFNFFWWCIWSWESNDCWCRYRSYVCALLECLIFDCFLAKELILASGVCLDLVLVWIYY
jgi:hypothetical protein